MSDYNTVNCPYCGSEISKKAKVCPDCGSDENTGWSEGRYLDGVGIPDFDDDDYQQMKEQEFGRKSKITLSWQTITGFSLLFLLLIFFLRTILNW